MLPACQGGADVVDVRRQSPDDLPAMRSEAKPQAR